MTIWLLALLAGAALSVLEWRRRSKRHRVVRVAAVLAACTALAALAAPPLMTRQAESIGTAILVTPGTTDQILDAARRQAPGAPVLAWPDSVADIASLRLRMPVLRQLHVTGWGLRESEWFGQDDLAVVHHAAMPHAGISVVAWPRTIRLGDPLPISAALHNSTGARTAWLAHPDGTTDSLTISGDSAGVARFTAQPGAEGRYHYLVGGDGMGVDSIPVAVLPPRPPSVLILEGAPAFETAFLRRWLAAQGAAVAVRTRLSRDQFRVERVNLPGVALGTVTDALLDRFDLLVMDGLTLAALGAGERTALDRALREGGLGVLLLPDSAARRDRQRFPFTLDATGDLEGRLIRVEWPGQLQGAAVPVPALAEEIRTAPGVVPLMRDPVGRVVAATAPVGRGVVGTSLISAPSRWLIEEAPDAYAAYWRTIIGALARDRADRWMPAPDGPIVVDQGVVLALVTTDTLPLATVTRPSGTVDTLGLAQDPAEPTRWWGRYWPLETGWHLATNQGGEPYPFDVGVMRESVSEVRARLAATGRIAGRPMDLSLQPLPSERRPLRPLIPFLALVLATGVLWGVERRGGE